MTTSTSTTASSPKQQYQYHQLKDMPTTGAGSGLEKYDAVSVFGKGPDLIACSVCIFVFVLRNTTVVRRGGGRRGSGLTKQQFRNCVFFGIPCVYFRICARKYNSCEERRRQKREWRSGEAKRRLWRRPRLRPTNVRR